MSRTKAFLEQVQQHPDYTRGYDDALTARGDRAAFNPPTSGEPGRDAYAYRYGWDECVDDHSARPGEP